MSSEGGAGRHWNQDGDPYIPGQPREPGGRRKKLAGYLRAANELRQTYQQSYMQSWAGDRNASEDDVDRVPGSYPNAAVARSGEEEMVIFPSYARRHIKKKPSAQPGTIQEVGGTGRDVRDSTGAGDAEFWKLEWDKYEDDNAIVDVDVRGWVYTPHKGPMTRKHRLFIGIARQMVGIPAPSNKSPGSSAGNSRSPSPHGLRGRVDAHADKHEQEIVLREAESILRRGEAEAQAAGEGKYSERPKRDSDLLSVHSLQDRRGSTASTDLNILNTTQSSMDPSQMSQPELTSANTHLLNRIKPFLANPLANTPISAFFYNENRSRQKTIQTNAAGHFSFRAALDFVPTHVRILASENLSATEEIMITEPKGISVVSDIDDTIKHSAISNGAREIFRNVFVRELGELSISGVKDWYNQLAQRGCKFHYVSNSPWQLYPVLTGFFSLAGLPAGSFHLKQYTGMFQGIFEPVAERKKSTLEQIMRDFPDRRFLLIGDSGEADLEVYVDVVLENPGRILGVFIRDVTTAIKKGFFDPAMGPLSYDKPHKSRSTASLHQQAPSSRNQEDDLDMKEAIRRSMRDVDSLKLTDRSDRAENRPRLPPRQQTTTAGEEDLIDLDSDSENGRLSKSIPDGQTVNGSSSKGPAKPAKPSSLKPGSQKVPPPVPRKPVSGLEPNGRESSQKPSKARPEPLAPPPKAHGYGSAAKEKINSAYNHLPSASSYWHGEQKPAKSTDHAASRASLSEAASDGDGPPMPPPRKQLSFPQQAAQSINSLYTSATAGNDGDSDNGSMAYGSGYGEPYNKKEEMWKRRWARAKDVLDSKGVMLRGWRVGEDVASDAIQLVERAQKDLEQSRSRESRHQR